MNKMGKETQRTRAQRPFNRYHLSLNNCKFSLGLLGEGLSERLSPYLSRPHLVEESGSLSTQPPGFSSAGPPGPARSWALIV